MSACAVLHVTSLPGGGVDRHIRDLARGAARRHLVWHVAESADVIEVLAKDHYHVLDRAAPEAHDEALARWLRAQGVGLVHAHSLARPARSRADWAMRRLGLPSLVTLHDVLFMR